MKRLLAGLLFSLIVVTPTLAATSKSGESVSITDSIADDVYLGGQSVVVSAPILGELFAGGETVSIANRPDRSILAGGNSVTIKAGAGYNAFVAGRTVVLDGEYGHDVFVAGSSVVIQEGTRIHGSLYVGGETVVLHGSVDGKVTVYGSSVSSDATIAGSVKVSGGQVTFAGGSIGGNLEYDGVAVGLEKIAVTGTTTKVSAVDPTSSSPTKTLTSNDQFSPTAVLGQAAAIFLFGAVLIWLMPKRFEAVVDDVKHQWVSRLGVGFLMLIVAPVLAMIAMMTVIGMPIAFALLMAYFFMLTIASFVSAPVLGRIIAPKQSVWVSVAAGALLVAILAGLPQIHVLAKLMFFVGLTLPILGSLFTTTKAQLE